MELEAQIAAFKSMHLTASYTLLNNKISRSNIPSEIGRRTIGVPRHTTAFWLDTAKQGQADSGWGGGVGVRNLGSRYNYANTIKDEGVWLADALIRYDAKDWLYKLNIRKDTTSSTLCEERTLILTATRRW